MENEDAQAGTVGLPYLDPTIAQKILTFLSRLVGYGDIPMVQDAQTRSSAPVASTIPKMGGVLGSDSFFRPLLGPVMTDTQHDMQTKFMKLKLPMFYGSESVDAYEFILYCYERLHKLGIVHQHGVEFVTFQLQGEANQW